MPDDTEGERIAQARRQLGVLAHRDITQSDLARLVGVSGNTVVWNWEEGHKQPGDANRAKLARVLGVTEAYLRYGTEPRELAGWTMPNLAILDLGPAAEEDARAATQQRRAAKKSERKRRRGGA